MRKEILAVVALAVGVVAQHENIDTTTPKAPMRFLWPPQRTGYDNSTDDQAPCGGRPIGTRADFPLTGGALAFVDGEDAFDAQVAISYKANPGADDFEDILPEDEDVDVGHTCYAGFRIKDGIGSGSPATFQIEYKSGPINETYYICADVNFVDTSAFKTQIPCFNATTEETNEQVASSSSAAANAASATASTTAAVTATSAGKVRAVTQGFAVPAAVGFVVAAMGFGMAM